MMTRRIVVDHVSLVVTDLAAARTFYAAALAPLGLTERGRDDAGGTGYGVEGGDDFWIGPALTGPDDRPVTRGAHVAFAAESREQVDAFFAAALAAGGSVIVKPGVQHQYSGRYYGAFVADPDGNNIEAVFHSPEPLDD